MVIHNTRREMFVKSQNLLIISNSAQAAAFSKNFWVNFNPKNVIITTIFSNLVSF